MTLILSINVPPVVLDPFSGEFSHIGDFYAYSAYTHVFFTNKYQPLRSALTQI
jgi:hypothetical protein